MTNIKVSATYDEKGLVKTINFNEEKKVENVEHANNHSVTDFLDRYDDEDVDFLQHYGVKGMRWGVRKDRPGRVGRKKGDKAPSKRAQVKAEKARIKGMPAHQDHIDARLSLRTPASKQSTKQLQETGTRAKAETRYSQVLKAHQPEVGKGRKVAKKLITGTTGAVATGIALKKKLDKNPAVKEALSDAVKHAREVIFQNAPNSAIGQLAKPISGKRVVDIGRRMTTQQTAIRVLQSAATKKRH